MELLSDTRHPHGFGISTEGVSVKYLSNENNPDGAPIIALDTQGGATPIKIPQEKGIDSQEYDRLFMEAFRDHVAIEDLLQEFIIEAATTILL